MEQITLPWSDNKNYEVVYPLALQFEAYTRIIRLMYLLLRSVDTAPHEYLLVCECWRVTNDIINLYNCSIRQES